MVNSENIFEGNFTVTKDMVENGRFIEGKIPRIINGDFICSKLSLTTLEGSPEKINGYFDCSFNKLTSLEFCPKEVESFYCSHNQLTNLEFCAEEVNGHFDCSYNRLTSLEFCLKKINGYLSCSHNQLTSLEFGPKKVGGSFWCFNNTNNLSIERDFIKSGMFKNNYYKELLDYMLSNNIDIKEVESWLEGFITNNLKRSIKGKQKFNL